jgi:hypothetical protein
LKARFQWGLVLEDRCDYFVSQRTALVIVYFDLDCFFGPWGGGEYALDDGR